MIALLQQTSAFIIRYEWLVLLLLLPLLIFPTGPQALLLLVFPVLWLLRWRVRGYFVPVTPYNVVLWLLLLMALVSLYATFDIRLSFSKIAGVVLGIGLFFAAVDYVRERPSRLWRVVGLVLLAGSSMATVGLVGTRWTGPAAVLNRISALLPPAIRQIPGTPTGVVNTNELAGVMAWVVPLALALLVGYGRELWGKRPFLLLALAAIALFTGGILVATLSRGGILALAVSVLAMAAIPTRWGRALLVVAIIAGITLVFYLDVNTVLDGNSVIAGEFGLDGRLEIWSRAIYGLQDFPFTGMSMNGFRRVVHILYPLFLISPNTDIAHAHNHLLQAGLDLGIPGLVAYLGVWLISAALLRRSWQQAKDRSHRTLIVGLSGAMVGGWIFGLLDAIALGARPGFLWWLLLALIAAVYEQTMTD